MTTLTTWLMEVVNFVPLGATHVLCLVKMELVQHHRAPRVSWATSWTLFRGSVWSATLRSIKNSVPFVRCVMITVLAVEHLHV